MGVSLSNERLQSIAVELVSRPGHEKVRALVYSLLVDGLGAESGAIDFEKPLPEVRGRADALLGRTIFEFKRDLRHELASAQEELLRYLRQRERETHEKFVGIATDGAAFLVYEISDGKLLEVGRCSISPEAPRDFLAWLDSVVTVSASLRPDPDTLRKSLGRESVAFRLAESILASLWSAVATAPEVVVKRKIWGDQLQSAYGSDVGDDRLFLQHTFLSIVAKAIAADVFGVGSQTASEMLSGKAFHDAGILGAVESDFFDWVLLAGEAGCDLVERLARQVNRFQWSSLDHDALKVLYESLIDPEERHELGEYYTPDWLAFRIVQKVFSDPTRQRALDPACGSGTFLFHAIRKLLTVAEAEGLSRHRSLEVCAQNVIGIDVHPLAVTIARVTYLLALGPERLRDHPPLSIPVYLGDSLQWNTVTFLQLKMVQIETHVGRRLSFPSSVAENLSLFDRVLDVMLSLSDDHAPVTGFVAWLRAEAVPGEEELAETYAVLLDLKRRGADHIWGYIARNLSRPIWLSSENEKADVLMGNPPWLSFRYMNQGLQSRFREECRKRGLWVGGSYSTVQDLSAYFFARCVELYAQPGGSIAFVMPLATVRGRQYETFRSGEFWPRGRPRQAGDAFVEFGEPWAFDESVAPLFPVPSCVLFANIATARPLPEVAEWFSGTLPRRDASPEEAEIALQKVRRPISPRQRHAVGLPYRADFRNGATLYPRLFWFVEPREGAGRLGKNPESPSLQSRHFRDEKTPWKSIPRIRGQVERRFLRPVIQGESLVPFRVLPPSIAIVPWEGTVLGSQESAANGHVYLAKWLRECETLWQNHSRGSAALLDRLDYWKNLTAQFPIPKLRVVYAKSGKRPVAALTRDEAAVVDYTAYWMATDEAEGAYLTALLNSSAVANRVEVQQTRGQFGPRDVTKLVFEVGIPRFEPSLRAHQLLSELGRQAEVEVASIVFPGRDFRVLRRLAWTHLKGTGILDEIDRQAATVLAETGTQASVGHS